MGIMMTLLVYGFVGLLVKLDDFGLFLTARSHKFGQFIGKGLLRSMPKIFSTLSTVGTAAMLWVGGGLFARNLAELGFSPLEKMIEAVEGALGFGNGMLVWLVGAIVSAVLGLLLGLLAYVLLEVFKNIRRRYSMKRAQKVRGKHWKS